MIEIVKKINSEVINNLFEIYAESMQETLQSGNYKSKQDMLGDYQLFLKEFISKPNQLVIVEIQNGVWVSGLRAIETKPSHWHIEAVETRPDSRQKGYGKKLLKNTLEYLTTRGMKSADCCIAKSNIASQTLHTNCGFVCTNKSPIYDGKPANNTQIYLFSNQNFEK